MIGGGDIIGDYEIVDALSSGGMATVYVGRRRGEANGAPVAIKVVHPRVGGDPHFKKMFLDEGRLSLRVRHKNVVRVDALGEHDGAPYLVMELVDGCSLAGLLDEQRRNRLRMIPELAVWIALQVAEGLHAAHETTGDDGALLGVVHRDVSPQNILLSRAGDVKLIDFGVAKARGHAVRTATGVMKGKYRYMAPEQTWGREIDRRADVFALGIVLWEMLTNRRLFGADGDAAVIALVRAAHVKAPSEVVEVHEALDGAVLGALSLRPDDRPPDALALAAHLREALPPAEVGPPHLAALLAHLMSSHMEKRLRRLPMTATLPAPDIEGSLEDLTIPTEDAPTDDPYEASTVAAVTPEPPPAGSVSTTAKLPAAEAPHAMSGHRFAVLLTLGALAVSGVAFLIVWTLLRSQN